MAKAYFLTEDDKNDVQALLAAFRSGRLSVRGNPSRLIDKPGLSPDVYIGKVLSAISALNPATDTGTGTAGEDIPGEGVVAVYQVLDDGTLDPYLFDTGNTTDVYNISDQEFGIGTWIQIQRDKFGAWLPLVSNSSGTFIKRGKLTTTLASGSRVFPVSAVVEIWAFDGTDWADSGSSETVYDDGMVPNASDPLPIGTWIQLVKIDGYWFYDGHNCDPQTGTGS